MAIKPVEVVIRTKDEATGLLNSIGLKLAGLATLVAGFFGVALFTGAVRSATEFEGAMSRVKAAAGATDAEFKALQKTAEDVGATTKFSGVQAAQALENLAKAGLNAKDSMAALPAVLALAQAGDIELGQSAEFVTKAVMGMGLQFSDAARVADVLAMGANASNTSVVGLAQALSYAAPTAKTLGLSLELTVAIIGKFADAGIDASRAGTALNAIMGQFSDPASKFRTELGAAGIITTNFEQALRELAKAGPAGAKAINAVGLEAGPALKALLGQGIGALDDLKGKLDDSAGSAAKMALVMQDNLSGSMTSLGSVWTTVKNVLGAPVLPVLKDAVDQLSGALRGLVTDGTIAKFGESMAEAFRSGIKWGREFIGQIDFKAITIAMQNFATRSGEVFTQIGEYAANTGNTVKMVYGVMSAGANAVMAVVFELAAAFTALLGNVQRVLAFTMEGLAKVSFGGVSASFKAAAAEIRLSAEATWAASDALAKKSEDSFNAMADSAQMARDGFEGLANGASAAGAASARASADVKDLAKSSEDAGTKAQQSAAKQVAAAEATRAAVAQLKTEYEAALAAGNVQLALEKLQQMKAALQGTADQAKLTAADVEAAFQRMGVTSSAELKKQADAALRDYKIIRDAGTSTAADITAAFKVYAEKSIAANNGVATETLKNEAAMKGLEIQTDATGKAIVKAMGEGGKAMGDFGERTQLTTEQVKAQEDAMDRLMMKYTLSADYSERQIALLEKENDLIERRDALERKRLNIDKEGFSLDTGGNRVNQLIQTQRSVFDQAKSQGLSEADALKIAKQFISDNGKKQGWDQQGAAQGKNWGTALQEAIDKIVLDNARQTAEAKTRDAAAPPAAATNPLNTTVNINLNGSTRSINTDAAGASVLQDVLRQLAAARGTSSAR